MHEGWLSADEAALVCAALATDGEAAAHWARFTMLFDFDDIWDDERYSMLPTVHLALDGVPGIVEGPRLAGIHRRTWITNQTAQAQSVEAVSVLGDAGIAACLHGDLAIAATFYPDLAARVIGDSEILVRADEVGAALDALAAAGWHRIDPGPLGALVAHRDGTVVARDGRDRLRLVWETCGGVAGSTVDRASAGEVIVQAELLPTDHGEVAVAPPAALAVHALCAGVGSQPGHRLRSLCDTARIVAGTPSAGIHTVDLDAIISRVDRLGVGAVVTHTVETLTAVTGIDADRFGAAVAALPVSAADRRRHAVLVRAARRRGRAHRLRAAWCRRTIGLSGTEAVRMAPRFLTTRWRLRSETMVPIEIVRRTARAVGASRPIRARGSL